MNVQKKYFREELMYWHSHENDRVLPWKEEKDPYKIWLSEIILQQTRAEQGLRYYLNFIEQYPTICDLAYAADEEVFRLWQGLGYYNRCKNMLSTARFICHDLSGKFPDQYNDILALKGVGAYTAAAIASFAFSLPYAVVDGNVYRVLSRFFGIESPIDTTEGKQLFATLAQELIDNNQPAAYNQAIMDLGATVCTPKQTKCMECPLHQKCTAFNSNLVSLLPIREKKLKVQERFFNFLVWIHESEVWIQRRTDAGIWQNLHQFYLIETPVSIDQITLQEYPILKECEIFIQKFEWDGQVKQRLTHQLIHSQFYLLQLSHKPKSLSESGFWIPIDCISRYAFPKTILDYFEASSIK